jgi:6-pyruvoyltetrahydropterin/6-carboxytetrahydropterin synthase
MDRISKEFTFSAAHRLTGLSLDHPCRRLHGHNYVVRVVLGGPLTEVGFVRDYGDLDTFKTYIDTYYDHRYLGYGWLKDDDGHNIEPIFSGNPTAENMASAFHAWLCDNGFRDYIVAVGVSETQKTWAWYQDEPSSIQMRIPAHHTFDRDSVKVEVDK